MATKHEQQEKIVGMRLAVASAGKLRMDLAAEQLTGHSLRSDIIDAKRKTATLAADLKLAMARLDEKSAENAMMGNQLINARAQIAENEGIEITCGNLEAKNATLAKHVSSLEVDGVRAKLEIDGLEAKNATLAKQISALNLKVRQAVSEAVPRVNGRIVELEAKNAALTAENGRLNRELAAK